MADGEVPPGYSPYSGEELLNIGQRFFGSVSGGLAAVLEKAISKYGLPNGYILGEEGSAAIVAGLRYGEGLLHTKNMGSIKTFWQGPSVGWDFGGDGNRTMMLVYNLPDINYIYRRFVGFNGSAYLVGGFGLTVLGNQRVYVIPVRSGIGARVGVNVGYLKFSEKPTWNPF
ncbi:MAG: DUF1134 domain-containing protein [Cohaesibacter sp.]|nr:DUF1134 domain-containing protein [Cohaesibacter sp.]